MIGGKSRAILSEDRGMALLITIMIVSLLVVVTLEFGRAMRQNHLASANLMNTEQLGAIARSGINLAVALLEKDGRETAYDTLLDDWSALERDDLSGLFDQGHLQLKVTDLSGRLQLNCLGKSGEVGTGTREILTRLLLSGEFTVEGETEAEGIVDSLVDWLDTDNRESDAGAENSYYQSLTPGYACKNGPVQFIEELLLVKGITPALLYGSEGKRGLSQYITVYGDDGKINLNTAAPELLQAIHPQMTRDLADELSTFRQENANKEFLANPTWYVNVPSWPGDIVLDARFLTTTSTYFSLEATGVLDTLKRKIVAEVRRTRRDKVTEMTRKVE